MKSKYQLAKTLINYLEEFENDSGDTNLYDFAEWLQYKLKHKSKHVPSRKNRFTEKLQPEFQNYIRSMNNKNQLLEYISRIARFQEFYSRRFFEDLLINSRLDFLFLHSINVFKNIKKTELINLHLVEYTTGMDTIKRLINQNLIKESTNDSDKRTKLLEITVKGKEVLNFASKRIDDKANMFFACINENKWKKLIPVLEEISNFHNEIYIKYNDKPFPELMNLMDSLKHYYK